MGGVGVLLHLECVVLDVVDGGEDDAGVILLHPGQDGFRPLDGKEREKFREEMFTEENERRKVCNN